jgi:hypothetical protein
VTTEIETLPSTQPDTLPSIATVTTHADTIQGKSFYCYLNFSSFVAIVVVKHLAEFRLGTGHKSSFKMNTIAWIQLASVFFFQLNFCVHFKCASIWVLITSYLV